MTYLRVKEAKKIAVGVKQTVRAIERRVAYEVILANDADSRITRDIADKCTANSIPVSYVDSMKKLGDACGIAVGAAAVAIVN